MEKLELKHLTPYLPYNLEAIDYNSGKTFKRKVTLNNAMIFVDKETKAKILLKPLSYLIKEVLYNEGFSCHVDYLTNENKGTLWTLKAPYLHVEFLFKNHFDVFGLIDKGLAIDINTI